MILIDANLLLYAYNEESLHHPASRLWLDRMLSSGAEIGVPLQSILAFIRISTNPKLQGNPASVVSAIAVVDSWLMQPRVRILMPGLHHWALLKHLCLATAVTGNLSTDAHLAALSIEHDGTLYTTDRDFARFPGLRWQNPLMS